MNNNKINYINKLLNNPRLLSEKFYQKIKIKKFIKLKYQPKEWGTVYFKSYPRLKEMLIPKSTIQKTVSFQETFLNRKSIREFSKKPLSLKKLSTLLYYSAGLKEKKFPYISDRFYPSAGSRYPLEVYLISLNIQKVKRGIYHYYLKNHSLENLSSIENFSYNKYFNQKWINNAACLVLITARFNRMIFKYGDRGYNYVLIEAGHLGQNFYIISAALDIHCCAIGGFIENELNKLIDLDGLSESVIYVLAFGESIEK